MTIRIALTLGDPRGIGPEVVEKAARAFVASRTDVDLLIVGPADRQPPAGFDYEGVGGRERSRAPTGTVAAECVVRAAELALDGRVHGIVTGPVHKPSLWEAGWDVPGQTEMLQNLAGSGPVGMLMAAEETRLGAPLRVLLATTHLPLREVPDRVTTALLVEQARLLHVELGRGWAIDEPRIALCALNPHASDGGLFGDEEARIFEPAVERLADEGVDVTGPHPADTVFTRALEGRFDAVVAPYHDVGMAAFKTVAFGRGVNVTLGLPFVRTSPDHGTAFDIAGRGVADPASALEALHLAVRLAEGRFDTRNAGI